MKKTIALICIVACLGASFAGNEDRVGSAGATQVLINPFARSSGWGDAGSSFVGGLEAVHLNVAGLAYTDKTEINFSTTNWLGGTGITINSLALAQKVGEDAAFSIGFVSMGFGDIPITTTELPEGGLGTFSPSNFMLNLAYAKEFSPTITGGIAIKLINEGISNARTSGVALDAGVRYVTGDFDHIRFGISLKNVGPPMSFSGDGLAIETVNPFTGISTTTQQRSARFELPSLINIGGSYDFLFEGSSKLTAAATYTSNSFSQDQYRVGAQYSMETKKVDVSLRAGMVFEKGMFNEGAVGSSVLSGPTAGVSLDFPISKAKSMLGIDYAYRTTSTFNGVHSIGVRLNLKKSEEDK